MRSRRRALPRFERRPRGSHCLFEGLRASRDNQSVDKLPADAFSYEEIIQLFLESRRFCIYIRLFVLLLKVRPDGFDDVVNLKPVALIYMPLDFTPYIRIGAPVAWVRPFLQNKTSYVPESTSSPLRGRNSEREHSI
jgi:hypothetical protein